MATLYNWENARLFMRLLVINELLSNSNIKLKWFYN